MKKRILSLALFAALSFSVTAQTDGFFYKQYEENNGTRKSFDNIYQGYTTISDLEYEMIGEEVPLCGSMYILSCMALGYAFINRRKENEK